MTGAEHYQRAEELIAWAEKAPASPDETNPAAALMLAQAQVHATLALAAATALPRTSDMYHRDRDDWERAAAADGPVFTR